MKIQEVIFEFSNNWHDDTDTIVPTIELMLGSSFRVFFFILSPIYVMIFHAPKKMAKIEENL